MRFVTRLHLAACGLLAAPSAFAQSVCDVSLTSRAFNVTQLSTSENIAMAKRDDLCNREYSSLEEAQNSAKSAGFNVSYAGVGVGASGAKQSGSSKVQIKDTEFCRATADDFKRSFSSNYNQQITDAALQAWTSCIERNSNQLSISYFISKDGQYFSGTIIKTATTGALASTITGISVAGSAAKNVDCNIGGVAVKPGKIAIPIDSTRTTFSCKKSTKDDVAIGVQTSSDALPPIHLPSEAAIRADRFDAIEARLSSLIPTAFANSVAAFESASCPAGWSEYREASGRVLVGLNSKQEDSPGGNGLPQYELAKNYGSPSVSIETANLPSHRHGYKDVFFSEAWGTLTVPGNQGSGKSDGDNKGMEIDRISEATGEGKPLMIQIPSRAILFCKRLG